MNVKIIEIDGSEGFVIPRSVLDRLGLKCGDVLELRLINDGFELRRPQEKSDDVTDAMRLAMKMATTALDELRK